MTPLTKTTTFTGRASGDGECFCFDKRTPEQWAKDQQLPGHELAAIEIEQAPQIYPDDLLPEGVGERMGRWTITVTFEPLLTDTEKEELIREQGMIAKIVAAGKATP